MDLLGRLVLLCALVCWRCHAKECACPTLNVHVRSGPGTSHSQLGMLIPPNCVTYKDKQTTADGYTWANVEFNGKDGWTATKWLTFKTCNSQPVEHHHTIATACPHIVSRQEWGARAPKGGPGHLTQKPKYIFVHHSATNGCHTKASCSQMVKSFQNFHMDGKHYSDIEYSFLIGEDGNVYDGRGWDVVGAHTLGHNHDGLGICVIGTFTDHLPNDAAMNTLKQLINCAASSGKVISSYVLKGHRDVRPTECPGQRLYDVIQTWPHYG